MSSKVFNLITGIVTGVEAIAGAICTFAISDAFIKGAVVAAIPIIGTAAISVCKLFVKKDAE